MAKFIVRGFHAASMIVVLAGTACSSSSSEDDCTVTENDSCQCAPDTKGKCPSTADAAEGIAWACGVADDKACHCEAFTCDGKSCGPAYGKAGSASIPAPSNGLCCVDEFMCMCYSGDLQYCLSGTPVAQCTAQVAADAAIAASDTLVDDCVSQTEREPGVVAGGPSCTNLGSCGPASNNCKCGSSCLHIGEGRYLCGFRCTDSDSTCESTTNPITKEPYSSCTPAREGEFFDFDGYCN